MSEKVRVLVVDDQYVARSFFEIHVQMNRDYELAASWRRRSRPSPTARSTRWTW